MGLNYEELGLKIILNFITEDEESLVLSSIKKNNKKRTKDRNSITRFGSNIPYKNNIISEEIPLIFDELGKKLLESNLLEVEPDSITINEYFQGQEIRPHIDSPTSGKVITILSLMSDAKMIFQKRKDCFIVDLPARSLVQMRSEIRNDWNHSILPVNDTRYSIVFRCSELKIPIRSTK